MENLKLDSSNVRGIESSNKKYIVKKILKMSKEIDLILLQDVKVIGFSLDNELKYMWKYIDAYFAKNEKGKGGDKRGLRVFKTNTA